jgi:predicted lipid-binding transport protein (Tim44 family)
VTQTAPRPAAPVERSVTQPGNPGVNQAVRPTAAARGPAGFFANRGGFFGGMMAGLLGAGLLGLLFGSGLFGGLGGLASILGLLLQLALVVFLARLAFRWFQRRNQPAYAGAPGPYAREAASPAGLQPGTAGGTTWAGVRREPITIQPSDYDSFERLLGAIQTAYGRGDRATLRRHTTPEVVAVFEEELTDNESRGVVNEVSEPKLLQGDLAEAWREGDTEYATVAMRFSLRDVTIERASGRVVEGDPERPVEATEIWTFTRPRGGSWVLSAIQQA